MCLFSYWKAGSPTCMEAIDNVVQQASVQGFHECNLRFASNLRNEVLSFCRVVEPQGPASRGTGNLQKILHELTSSSDNLCVADLNKLTSAAIKVDPNRMSLPEQAGLVDPSTILRGHERATFLDLHNQIPKTGIQESHIKPCHMVDSQDEKAVYTNLLKANMAVLIPEASVARDSKGRAVTGGLFSVPHKSESDRLINDRRPLNQLEERLQWGTLPRGVLLTQIILKEGEKVRGCGDDLSNFLGKALPR